MKFDLGKVIGIAGMVHGLVLSTQHKLKDKTGKEKHAAVVEQVKELLPIVEGITGKDLADDALYLAAIDELIRAEKAVAVARARVAQLIADIKSR
jgi:hypothetical protein